MEEYVFKVWTEEAVRRGVETLKKKTAVELVQSGISPGILTYILELRNEAQLWKELFNQELDK